MQIELLETFLDLFETGSFNRTAERLAITQSSVSGRIKALEASLGARLFARSKAGTNPTPAGNRFARHAIVLRREWNEACRAVRASAISAQQMRIGIQSDLAPAHAGEWMMHFRKALPSTSFYIEPDYSSQMCQDLLTGTLDIAVLYSPRHAPDLHLDLLGEVAYEMVCTHSQTLAGLDSSKYILAGYSPAFEAAHRHLLPDLADTPVAAGQGAAICSLLTTLGGAAYVIEETAKDLVQSKKCLPVADAPVIDQPVFVAVHIRNRHKPEIRKIQAIIRKQFAAR